MGWRATILNNFRWKVLSLMLATFIWVVIKFAIWTGVPVTEHPFGEVVTKKLVDVPVAVLKNPEDPRIFRVTPGKVEITLRAEAILLRSLAAEDIDVFVNLTKMPEVPGVFEEVQVHAPRGIRLVKVEPPAVGVEQVPAAGKNQNFKSP